MALLAEFGIDDMKIGAYTGATAPTVLIDFPARAISISTESDSEDFEADNKVVVTRRYNKKATGSIETATHDPAVLAIIGTGAVTTTGTAPNQTTVYTEPSASVDKSIYMIARAMANDGSVVELRIMKSMILTGPNFDWSTGAHSGVTADYSSAGDAAGNLYSVSTLAGTAAVTTIPTSLP